jgi:hypothetical protein
MTHKMTKINLVTKLLVFIDVCTLSLSYVATIKSIPPFLVLISKVYKFIIFLWCYKTRVRTFFFVKLYIYLIPMFILGFKLVPYV